MNRYPHELDDGGRKDSKRPYQINDCTVRAMAIAAMRDYDEVYDLLKKAGRKSHQGFDLDGWLAVSPCKVLGSELTKVNKRGLTVDNFHERHPCGRYIIQTENHVWAVKHGIHHDLIRVRNQPLTSVWRVYTPL